jgi:CDP-glucose 4,6-dehydratase
MQGHTVSGISLAPSDKSLFNQAGISEIFAHDIRLDIRDRVGLKHAVETINPEVIIHLAAQPLVRESYRIPVETFEVNVIGTLNVLEATRELNNLKAALIITTDKVYKNHNYLRGYVETDELGGTDPYSASKAAADIAVQSWIKNFAKVPITLARAGNVIGGGDWAVDRIIPDLVNAYSKLETPILRYPDAIRPWQHVLDCINGYLLLINQQLEQGITGEWNFGPSIQDAHSVRELVEVFAKHWQVDFEPFQLVQSPVLAESNYLLLDSTKSRLNLGWTDALDFENTVRWTVDFYKQTEVIPVLEVLKNQISDYLKIWNKSIEVN